MRFAAKLPQTAGSETLAEKWVAEGGVPPYYFCASVHSEGLNTMLLWARADSILALHRFQILGEGAGFQDGDGVRSGPRIGNGRDLPLYSK